MFRIVIEQSASFPGKCMLSSAFFLLTRSLAFLAASLASAARRHFSIIFFPTDGFSSRNSAKFSSTIVSTADFTSPLPSFVFVCPSNCGSATLTEITAVNPSLKSSPDKFIFPSFIRLFLYA